MIPQLEQRKTVVPMALAARLVLVAYWEMTGGTAAADPQNLDADMPERDTHSRDDAAFDILDATVERSDTTIFERDAVLLPDDGDGDGASDSTDNCVNVANPDQLDSDRDGLGCL